jgi:iron complex outermembrane receptor protein
MKHSCGAVFTIPTRAWRSFGGRTGAIATAAGASLLASASYAQTSLDSRAPDETAPIENVLVTAQKRGNVENAQSVPIALTAFGAARLDELQIGSLRDLSTDAPNVTLADAGTLPSYANFTIRGLGINSSIPSTEPAVGVFVDGIYLGMSAGAVLDLFDIEDVEILRGPQATLFGRNTTGGAVLINTRRPGDRFAVRGRVSVETGLEEKIGFSVESPIGNQLRAKITAYHDNDAGWFTNQFDGRSFGAKRTSFVRPTIVWSPSAALDTTLIYERGATRDHGAVAQNPAYFQGFTVNIDNPGYNKLDWEAVTSESNWRGDAGIVTNLFGYRSLDQGASNDTDARPVPAFHGSDKLDQHQFSDELRFSGRFFDRLDVTAGLYYFTQSFSYLERRLLFGGLIDSTLGGKVDATNYAVFADADYHILPEVGLIAGGRFTTEKKSAQIASFVPSTAGSRCNFVTEACAFNFPGNAFPGAPGSDSWDNFIPKLGVEWRPDERVFVYGTWTRGVRSGGYNVRSSSFTIAPGPYDPELQDTFEVGWKSDWFERRLRFNGALFHSAIKDMQRDVNQTDPIAGIVQVTANTADATIRGFEAEIAGALTGDLVLNANAGFTEGKYNSVLFDLDGGGIGQSDLALQIPRLSKWSYSIGAAYTHDFGEYTFELRADYGYRSPAAYSDSNATFLAPVRNLTAGASLAFDDRHWTVSVYGRNLLDTVTDGVVAALPASLGGGAFRTLNEGRVIGAELRFAY